MHKLSLAALVWIILWMLVSSPLMAIINDPYIHLMVYIRIAPAEGGMILLVGR